MLNHETPSAFYNRQLAQLLPQLKTCARYSRLVSTLRLAAMLTALVCAWQCFKANADLTLYLALAVSAFAIFLALVYYHTQILERERFLANLVQINRAESAYLEKNTFPGKDGSSFRDTAHPFTHDLDLLGAGSLFHHINRTVMPESYRQLGQLVIALHPGDVKTKQAAIQELVQKAEWRQQYAASGTMPEKNMVPVNTILSQLQQTNIRIHPVSKWLMWMGPAAIIAVLIAGSVTDFEVWPWLTWLFIGNLLLVGLNGQQLKTNHQLLNNIAPALASRAAMLQYLESESFHTPLLQQIQAPVKAGASVAVKRLSGLLDRFDKLYNVFSAVITNGLFQYHNHSLVKLRRWQQQHGAAVAQWMDALVKTDALNSLANYAFNQPAFIYPTVTATKNTLNCTGIAHPLLNAKKRVSNDIRFDEHHFYILTGSNMAGKSTFLRTLGMNLCMANMGLPVCATGFEYSPFSVFCCMRIDDSLLDSESYFYAELKRLHRLMEVLQTGDRYFILLDEILRGTNSDDKYSGTIGLVQQLMQQNAWGMLATHDLKVAEMEKDYPGAMGCCCFEAGHVNGQLVFDYKLRSGVSVQKSATTLMLQMGIIQKNTSNS
jgi:hypothetical protein